jgi:CheY-specific phosphatase CheX
VQTLKIDSKNNIAIVRPQGFLDGNNCPLIITQSEIAQVVNSKYDCFFISLKNVVLFNYNSIITLSDILINHIWAQKRIPVGFCHYDSKKYALLLKYLGSDPKVALIEDESHLQLFFQSKASKRKTNVLLWCDDVVRRGLILYTLLDRGASPVVSKNEKEFIEESKDAIYQYKVKNCYIGSGVGSIASYIRGDAMIYLLSGFLDSDKMDTFDVGSLQNSLSVGFRLFVFDCSNTSGINSHAINYIVKLVLNSAAYNPFFAIIGFPTEKLTETMRAAFENVGIGLYPNFEIFESDEILSEFKQAKRISTKQKSITKAQISALPTFIDATIETIEVLTGEKAIKQSVQHTLLESKSFGDDYFAASVGFYGGLEGVIALMFHKNTAKKACSVLIGTDDVDDETACDMLGEFVNIIMGKAKTLLSRQSYNIKISLPKTFDSPNSLAEFLSGKTGVMIDFLFDNEKFRFYLTN